MKRKPPTVALQRPQEELDPAARRMCDKQQIRRFQKRAGNWHTQWPAYSQDLALAHRLAKKPKSEYIPLQDAEPEEEVATCLRATVVTTMGSGHTAGRMGRKRETTHVM